MENVLPPPPLLPPLPPLLLPPHAESSTAPTASGTAARTRCFVSTRCPLCSHRRLLVEQQSYLRKRAGGNLARFHRSGQAKLPCRDRHLGANAQGDGVSVPA